MSAAHSTVALDSVEQAIADIAAGKAVVVVDNEDRENEGDLIFAAELATPELAALARTVEANHAEGDPLEVFDLDMKMHRAIVAAVRRAPHLLGVEAAIATVEEPHAALTAAESALDAIPLPDRPLWLLPLRAELAILRRRSTS